MLPLPIRLKLSAKILRSIDARREATGDRGIGSAAERDTLDYELAELALEWVMNPQSPRAKPVTNTLTFKLIAGCWQQAVRTARRELRCRLSPERPKTDSNGIDSD